MLLLTVSSWLGRQEREILAYLIEENRVLRFILHPSFDTRAPSIGKAIDIPNNLVVSWTYELPFGPEKRFANGGSTIVQKLLEGWAVNGITMYQTGEPLNVTVASSLLNTGSGNWANVTCTDIGITGRVDQWFDTSCFANPPQFQFGNYEIGQVRGPALINTDFSSSSAHVSAARALSNSAWRRSISSIMRTSAIRTHRSATRSSAGSPRRACRRGRFSSGHACCSEVCAETSAWFSGAAVLSAAARCRTIDDRHVL
jgi:hypothetical protein